MFTHCFRFTLLLLGFTMLFAACGEDDNPIVDDDHDHEGDVYHADADGFVLKVDGKQIYRQFQGEHTGSITLKVGGTLDVLTMFLDHDESEFLPNPPEEGEEHGDEHDAEEELALGISSFDSSIIEVHLYEEEGHDEEGEEHGDESAEKFTFEVKGLKAGKTEFKLQLLHGDHPDFTAALSVPVTVTP